MSGRQRKTIAGAGKRFRGGGKTASNDDMLLGGEAFVAAVNEGTQLYRAGRLQEALTALRKAMVINPNNAVLCCNLGVVLAALGEPEDAIRFYNKGSALDPKNALIQSNLADTLIKLRRYDEAVAAATRACSLAPGDPMALNNLGSSLFEAGRLDEAAVALRRSLQLNPDAATALCNLGSVLRDMGELDEALKLLRRALELAPNLAGVRKNLGMTLMQQGKYREGWPYYGARWEADGRAPRDYPHPLWAGEPLGGRTILLYSEQGLGDAIQFARFVPVLAEAGARVVLEVHPQLIALMRSLKGAAEIIPLWGELPEFDVYLPLMDVPAALGMTVDTIPCPIPYLAADPQRSAQWRERLGEHGFKVGIVWQGHNDTFRKRARTAPLEAFAPLAEIDGVRLIGLQKPDGTNAGLGSARVNVETFGPDFDAGPDAFMDTAAVIANLDLVVTIDTSVAHLAGAMGRPVWIALPRVPDWRFGTEGSDCPWYPTARLFRQQSAGDWRTVFADIAGQLQALAAGSSAVAPPCRVAQGDSVETCASPAPALVPLPAPAAPPTPASNAAPLQPNAHLAEFLRRMVWEGAPELAAEPHLSITATTIDSLHARGLLSPGTRILDVGCGHGLALNTFRKLNLAATGITSAASAEICRAQGLDARVMDQNQMTFDDASFDFLWCRQVLQRSPVPVFTLSEYRRVVRPGGIVYIDVPAPDTEAHHEANPAYFSVLPLSSWLSLFARAGFTVETGSAISVGEEGKRDIHWSFLMRRKP